ncbi:AmmeMemoRadiSam system protein B [Candidatus Micrarchaeota archaeon]|nr:AmmeMemoRadiSam system protein B [Candidatus Micrarchaeota archaeon]MBD3417431.1 AmmeMemoRadiSam system protein B [Candidatus Micrarchaeota archaeon]
MRLPIELPIIIIWCVVEIMRNAAVAGQFYPGNKEEAEEIVEKCFSGAREKVGPVSAYAGVAPHAGYLYSGVPAAATFLGIKELADAETVVVAGPNHTGIGGLVALSTEDWKLPTGVVKNDREFGGEMARNANFLKPGEEAHRFEHSIEVQLPFLQHINPKAKIVPVCMMDQSMEGARDVADAVLAAEKTLGRKVVVLASSDFSHYVPSAAAERADKAALEHICGLDAEAFQRDRRAQEWSICGYGPISVSILYAKAKGSKKGLELMYTNSGEVTGDYSRVVAYASIIFPR